MNNLKEILSKEFYSNLNNISHFGEVPEGSESLLINEISKNIDNNIIKNYK